LSVSYASHLFDFEQQNNQSSKLSDHLSHPSSYREFGAAPWRASEWHGS
jgi:hypothetical protein